jgi:hypothetical protein
MARIGRRREHVLWAVAVVALSVAVVPLALDREREQSTARVTREDAALAAARAVAEAERAFHAKNGRYGWLEELRAAALLAEWPTVAGPHGMQVASDGYRLDVLLPRAAALREEIPIAPRDAGPAEPTLSSKHFAVVARPVKPGVDGFRIWYVDEEGRVFLSEGAVDTQGLRENPLPPLRVNGPDAKKPGLVWRWADDVERN